MEVGDKVERQVRAAQNQALFRAVNERLQGLAEAFEFIAQTSTFVCECADTSCTTQISLSMAEYEALRADANQFAVARGHVYADVERVVAENERFTVVAKIEAGAAVAKEHDPRSRAV